jgi:hypothetical protein
MRGDVRPGGSRGPPPRSGSERARASPAHARRPSCLATDCPAPLPFLPPPSARSVLPSLYVHAARPPCGERGGPHHDVEGRLYFFWRRRECGGRHTYDGGHGVAVVEKTHGGMRADEPRTARHHDVHLLVALQSRRATLQRLHASAVCGTDSNALEDESTPAQLPAYRSGSSLTAPRLARSREGVGRTLGCRMYESPCSVTKNNLVMNSNDTTATTRCKHHRPNSGFAAGVQGGRAAWA